jgi:hypothetical protein
MQQQQPAKASVSNARRTSNVWQRTGAETIPLEIAFIKIIKCRYV